MGIFFGDVSLLKDVLSIVTLYLEQIKIQIIAAPTVGMKKYGFCFFFNILAATRLPEFVRGFTPPKSAND